MCDPLSSLPRFVFVAIEGIDGAGKTTVARKLANRLLGGYLRTPPPGFAAARKRVDSRASMGTRYLFYLASVAYASDLIRGELARQPIVCDRYILSTVACHRALGVKSTWNLTELGLLKPDYTFFLKVSDEDVRQGRLRSRNRITDSDRLLEDAGLRSRILAEYQGSGCIEIDTTGLSAEQVVDDICSRLGLGARERRRVTVDASWPGVM